MSGAIKAGQPVALVIDDDPMFRAALEAVFPRFGLEVRSTDDPRRFVELSRQLKPDLHVVDLVLTDIKGFELIKQVRAADPRAVILVISGVGEKADIAHALEMGANDFILKPLDRVHLASKLSRYVDTARLRENRSQAVEPPDGRAPARLGFGLEVTEVDELGLMLSTRHLVPKGTVLRLKTDFFARVAGVAAVEEVLVTVASTELDPGTGLYSAYVEFDEPPAELVDGLRKWLNSK
jgi:DNA-binding response OmpR family regulator